MNNLNIYNDPIISKRREGTSEDPFINIVEVLQVINGKAILTEIPNRFQKVKISDPHNHSWFEIENGELNDNLFKVDYAQGVVNFSFEHNGKELTFSYLGEGVHYFPSDRIYLEDETSKILTVKDKMEDIDRELLEQRNRVNEHIQSVPQPSEVVDIRIDNNGKVYQVAKERIDAEQVKIENTMKEIETARKSVDGIYHAELKDRLDTSERDMDDLTIELNDRLANNEKKLDDFIIQETEFDYTTVQPVYHTTLNLVTGTVNQGVVIDELTGDIYATQLNNNLSEGASSESFSITRMNSNGVILDSMDCKYGGHGTSFGIERENNILYIWSNYDIVNQYGSTIGTKLVRFPYRAGTLIDGTNAETFDKFTLEYITPVTDQKNGLIAFRISNSSTNQVVELRKLSDVKNGVNKVLGTVQIPAELHYLQGITIDGYNLYWYNGDTNAAMYKNELSMFSFEDGQLKKRITCDFGKDANGNYEDGFREPEGLYLYTDPKSGKKSLFAVVVTGAVGRRIIKLYAYHQDENAGMFSGLLSSNKQEYSLTKNNGSARRLPVHITKLSDFRTVGYYYLTTPESTTFTDHPEPDSAGWWLDILPSDSAGSVRQRLTRNSTGRSIRIYERVVTYLGVTGEWDLVSVLGKADRIPEEITKLSDWKYSGHYYISTAESNRFTDHPEPDSAGWWLDISSSDPNGSVIQKLTRNSTGRLIRVYERVVTLSGASGEWVESTIGRDMDWTNIPLKNGATNYDGSLNKLQFAVNGGLLFIRGIVAFPNTDGLVFATLPEGIAPKTNWYHACLVGGTTGTRKVYVRPNGDIVNYGLIANIPENARFSYIYLTIPLG